MNKRDNKVKNWWITILKVIASIVGVSFVLYFLAGTCLICSQAPIKERKTEVLLAELESAMSMYQLDFGNYPQWNGSDEDGTGLLFQELMKRPDNLQYLRESFPTADFDGKTKLIDAWGNPFRYRIDPINIDPDKRKAMNPTYDIWSTGGAKPGADEDQSKWITNWKSR